MPDEHNTEHGGVSMETAEQDAAALATELRRCVKQIAKVEAILVKLRERKTDLLRELGGA